MKSLIENIFIWQGYGKISLLGKELYICTDPDKKNYWAVCYGEPNISAESQAKLLDECSRAVHDSALDKNINLLIVWQVDELDDRTSRLVHHAEEDSYFFKKHVLPYTYVEFESLQNKVENLGFESVFYSVLTDPQTFQEYKNKYRRAGWQNLLYRLAIKVSTLPIKVPTEADLSNLENNISNRIKDDGSLLATESALLELYSEQPSWQEIEPDDLLKEILYKLEGVGGETNN